jgi:hypothetical protein
MSDEAPSPGRSVGPRHQSRFNVTQDALNDLAGTGTARHRHFVSLVDAYHREWRPSSCRSSSRKHASRRTIPSPLPLPGGAVRGRRDARLHQPRRAARPDSDTGGARVPPASLLFHSLVAAAGFGLKGEGSEPRAGVFGAVLKSGLGIRGSGLWVRWHPICSLQSAVCNSEPRPPSPEPIEVTARWVRRRLRAPRDDSADGLRQCR